MYQGLAIPVFCTSMSRKLAWGIIGTGGIAWKFASEIPHSSTGRLVAVGSRTRAGAERFALDYPGLRMHASYEALLADPGIDAVYISTPHPQHAEWAIAAAEAGKHILCEKPLALNHAEAMTVIEAARRHRVFLMEAFMYRCHARTAKIVELIRSGEIGRVRLIRAAFSFAKPFDPESRFFSNQLGGGGILDVGCYTASVARLVAGASEGQPFLEPVEVSGSAEICETGVDAIAAATLRFPNGVLAQLSCGVALRQTGCLEVLGDAGWMKVVRFWAPPGPIEIFHYATETARTVTAEGNPYKYAVEVDAVAAALPEFESPCVSWADTLSNMRTLDLWRETANVAYLSETSSSPERKLPISRRPLQLNRWQEIPSVFVAGLSKPVSRLILGVDNQRSQPHMDAMADDFVERGGTAFDTAHVYRKGRMEELLGHWIAARGVREHVVVTVKGAHTPFCYPDDLREQFDVSLGRLQTDYADVYIMHRDNPDVPVSEFVDALNELHARGRIRLYGGSNWSLERLAEANAYAERTGRQPFRVVSNNLSLAEMVNPVWSGCVCARGAEWRRWFQANDAALFSWSSQARGYFAPGRLAGSVSDDEVARCWDSAANRERKRRAAELANEKGVSPLNIALAFVLSQPFASFAVIGPRTVEETRTALPGAKLRLSEGELAWLDLEIDQL